MGAVNLLNVEFDNDEQNFGLYASTWWGVSSVSFRDTVTGERWSWTPRGRHVTMMPDLEVQLL